MTTLHSGERASPANRVWGIGHLREAILDYCAELFLSPVQRQQFFGSCISRLDKASVRECARHAHSTVYLDRFPWDCPDSDRLRWYAMSVKKLIVHGAIPMCHRWTLAELFEQFPKAEEIVLSLDKPNERWITLYRPGHPECCEPDLYNFVSRISLNWMQIPPDMFFDPDAAELDYVHYCDLTVEPEGFFHDGLVASINAGTNIGTFLLNAELPPVLEHPIRWLRFVTRENVMMNETQCINVLRTRKHYGLPTLGIDTGLMPLYCNFFVAISPQVGDDLRWVRMRDMEGDLGAVLGVFSAARYPKLEELRLQIEPMGREEQPLTEELPPRLKKIDVELSLYTFSLNMPESTGLFPEQRLPLEILRSLRGLAGPGVEITARVVTNAAAEQPRLQALVNEALA